MTPKVLESITQLSEPLFGSAERLKLLLAASHILVIDDEEPNIRLLTKMLHRAGYRYVSALTDGRNLEAQLEVAPPDLVISDLHMPHRDGFDVLQTLRHWIVTERLPVLVVSGDSAVASRNQALALGARDFLTKPFDATELTLRVRNQLETRLLYQDLTRHNRALHDAIHGRTQELEEARIEMLERLAIAAEYRDDDTKHHTERVGTLCARLGAALGMDDSDVQVLRRAAALHDIGKIGIPDAMLLKPGSLTDEEMSIMRTHTTIGAHILGGSQAPILKLAEIIALTHHERWDGCGYPQGIAGHDIPRVGRIVAVADAFDALTNDRPYRRAQSVEIAMVEIARHSGTQFDPAVVDAFKRLMAH